MTLIPGTQPVPRLEIPVDPGVIATLTEMVQEAITVADTHQLEAGRKREEGRRLFQEADEHTTLAERARNLAAARQQLLDIAKANLAPPPAPESEEGRRPLAAPAPVPAPMPYPPIIPPRENPDGSVTPAQRVCERCGNSVGPAKDEELTAFRAGRPLAHVADACRHCNPRNGATAPQQASPYFRPVDRTPARPPQQPPAADQGGHPHPNGETPAPGDGGQGGEAQ